VRLSPSLVLVVAACAGRSTVDPPTSPVSEGDRAVEVHELAPRSEAPASTPAAEPEPPLDHRLEDECPPTLSPARVTPGEASLEMPPPNPGFAPARADLQRIVTCEYRDDALVAVSETFYLTVESQPRTNPGYDHKNTTLSADRYFVRCQGALRTSWASFRAGQELSFATNTFTLPCKHVFFTRAAPNDVDEAAALSGRYSYGVKRAELEILAGPTNAEPTSFELAFHALVQNPVEALDLDGTVAGTMATTIRCLAADRWDRQWRAP
jgi:hypothetical protein